MGTRSLRDYVDSPSDESNEASSSNGDFEYVFDPRVTVQSGVKTEIEFDNFNSRIKEISIINSESNADIMISLRLEDGSVKKIYFDAEERIQGGNGSGGNPGRGNN
ncbi:hypothetical protein [Halorubrum sp. C191]|uniref:hypothetical protein n=1 Tax=Halorubrum sp. C191 TaxID=1383842 RepID=UPI0011405DD4|nr:hypothetical protein [Halorubrum sp. C191]